jgi:hypothetical protein
MPLYTDDEIEERVEGLIHLMFENPVNGIAYYQADIFRFILYELFQNANDRHRLNLAGQYNANQG